jgi:tetratricopeptide (TPR) repeat protein
MRSYFLFILALSGLLILSNPEIWAASEDSDLSKGYQHLYNGEYTELVKLIAVNCKKKGHSVAWDELSALYYSRSDAATVNGVASKLKLTLESQPNNAHLLATYAFLLIAISDDPQKIKEGERAALSMREKALAYALKAVSLDPKDGRNYAVLSACYAALRQKQEGIESVTQALKLSPNDFEVNELAAKFYNGTTLDTKATIGCYERLTKVYPNSPYVWVKLGDARENDNDLKGALEDYTIAIQKNPKYTGSYHKRAGLERHMEHWADSVRDYSMLIDNGVSYRLDRSNCYEMLNQHDKALADLNVWMHLVNQNYEKAKGIKITPENEKDFEAEIAKIDKGYRSCLFRRADIMGKMDHYEEAISALDPILLADPMNEAALDKRQTFRRKINRYTEALADINKLLILHHASEWYAARADVYTHLGQKDKAAADKVRAKETAF